MSEFKQKTREQLEAEIQAAVGKLILSHLGGRRELARAIFDALVPPNGTPYFNAKIKILTELTLGTAGGEDEPLENNPGERPRLKTMDNRSVFRDVDPRPRTRYTLAELLAACDFSQPQSAEEREWVDAPAVGDELI